MNKIDLIIREASKKDVPEMLELIRKYERYDEEYLAFQKWFRSAFKLSPLDAEFKLWIGEPIE